MGQLSSPARSRGAHGKSGRMLSSLAPGGAVRSIRLSTNQGSRTGTTSEKLAPFPSSAWSLFGWYMPPPNTLPTMPTTVVPFHSLYIIQPSTSKLPQLALVLGHEQANGRRVTRAQTSEVPSPLSACEIWSDHPWHPRGNHIKVCIHAVMRAHITPWWIFLHPDE